MSVKSVDRFRQISIAGIPGPRLAAWLLLAALFLLVAAASCDDTTPDREPEIAASSPTILAWTPSPAPTAIPSPTPTATPSPTPTATARPTPTPLAVEALAALPAGQVLLTIRRDGEEAAEWWHLPAGGELALLWPDLAGDLWDCTGEEALSCAAIGAAGGVQFFPSIQADAAILLDSLPVPAAGPPATALALSPRLLALSTQEALRILDAEESRPLVTLAMTGTTALRWAPDGERLAARFQRGDSAALAIWQQEDFEPRVLFQMDRIGQFVWAGAGDKLAVIASHAYPAGESVRQASDLFVLYLRSGEIRNFTESAMPFPGRDAVDALDSWPLTWTADDSAVRYARGVADDPETAIMVLHPLGAFQATPLWPAAEEGELGLLPSPGGQYQARLLDREGRKIVQVRQGERDWERALAVVFPAAKTMMWAPASADGSAQVPMLLVTEPQALWLLDVPNAQVDQLLAACAGCQIGKSAWLP